MPLAKPFLCSPAIQPVSRGGAWMNTRKIGVPFAEVGTLYTLGYADPTAAAQLERALWHELVLVVDIRASPRSRWFPAWNRAALEGRYGHHYTWEPRLGNVHYRHRELGIQLAPGHREAIEALATLLCEGTNVVLLCACKDARTCHRSLVAKLIQDAVHEQREEVKNVDS